MASDSDSKTEGPVSEAVDSASSENIDPGSEHEVSKDDDDETRSNRTNIRATFRKLMEDVQKFVGHIENHDDSQNSNAELSRNVEHGHRLVDTLEMDTSEAAIILEHTLVVAKAVKVYEKNCGRTDMNHFKIEKFLKAIKDKAMRSPGAGQGQRQYEEGKMHEYLMNTRRVHSCIAREPLTNLLGAITIRGPLDLASGTATTEENKKTKRASAKARFDDTNLEQHEVVNTQVGGSGSQEEKNNPLEQSAIKARELKDICNKKHENDMSLVDYGLYGHGLDKQVGTPREFLQHVFDASVITRDGYAQVTFPASKKKTIPKKMVTMSNCQTSIRAAKPPEAATPDSYDLHRFQQIISFNSGTIKNLLRNQQNQPDNAKPGQEGFLSQTDDDDETPTTSCLTSRRK